MRFVISTQNVEFSATLTDFLRIKIMSATTFNTDNCSLGLPHYADNSHHSCRGPTFEKNLFVWRLFQQRWQRRFSEIRLKRH